MAYRALPDLSPGTEKNREPIKALLADLADRKEFFTFRTVASEQTTRNPPKANAAENKRASGPPGPVESPGELRGYGGPASAATGQAERTMRILLPGLKLHGAQLFVKAFASPDTPYARTLLNWQTGTGKSIAAVSLALEYINAFRRAEAEGALQQPSVFVLGFTIRQTILAEMLAHPEFGFVAPAEAEALRRAREAASLAGPASEDAKRYSSLAGTFRRRVTDRKRGGFFQFFGYKEFANRLFTVTTTGQARGFSVQHLYERSLRSAPGRETRAEAPESFGEKLAAEVKKGNVEVNTDLLEAMKGGFLIADEIHNVYNMLVKNNYGVAIQYALDALGRDAPRALFMSATPMKGSAMEVVDLLNLLVPREALPGGVALRRQDFFETAGHEPPQATQENESEPPSAARATESPEDDEEGEGGERQASRLLPGALERIEALAAGRVSFLLDTDVGAYPKRIFVGDDWEGIPYLKFTPCPVTAFHARTIAHARGEDAESQATKPALAITSLAAGAYTLYDMVFPNPDFGPDAANCDAAAFGQYLSGDTPTKLSAAPDEWRDLAGVEVRRGQDVGLSPGTIVVGGQFLRLASETKTQGSGDGFASSFEAPCGAGGRGPGVEAYSGKYARLVQLVLSAAKAGPGKIMIYHHRVRMSGVLLIAELLRANGFLDEEGVPSAQTLCGVCGATRSAGPHAATAADQAPASGQDFHGFVPARFVAVHSDVDRAVMDRSIARFNAPANSAGHAYRILVGSKIIREAFTFRAVRHQFVCSLPTDIPTLLQVIGRVVRRESHAELPPEQRDVRIHILVSQGGALADRIAPELARYAHKMREYLVIQELERALRLDAVDGFANFGRMLSADPSLATRATLDALPYQPALSLAEVRGPLRVATFEAYGHGEREIAVISGILRMLFRQRPVWRYEDLWEAVRSGVVAGVAHDPKLFDEGSFALALDALRKPFDEPPAAVAFAPPYLILAAAYPSPAGRIEGTAALFGQGDNLPPGAPAKPKNLRLDFESYIRDVPGRTAADPGQIPGVRVRVSHFLRAEKSASAFFLRVQTFRSTYFSGSETAPPLEFALVDLDAEFHTAMLRALVEASAGAESDGGLGLLNAEERGRLVALYLRFGILFASAPGKSGVRAKAPASQHTLRGFAAQNAAMLYEPLERTWAAVPLESQGIGQRQLENEIVVGFVPEAVFGAKRGAVGPRLRLRRPIQQIKARVLRPTSTATVPGRADIRTISRGAVCETRPREELRRNLGALDRAAASLSAASKAAPKRVFDPGRATAADLCAAIKLRLLRLEEHARRPPNGMAQGLRWLYLFHDRAPSVLAVAP